MSLATILAVVVAGVFLADVGSWDLTLLCALGALAALGDIITIRPKNSAIRISGGFLGLVLAMAMLGPAQAAIVGVVSLLPDFVMRRHRSWTVALSNVAVLLLFPFVGSSIMFMLSAATGVQSDDLGYVLVMAPGFAAATLTNFLWVAFAERLAGGPSIKGQLRSVFVPVIPSELVMLLIASIILYAVEHLGPAALVTAAALLVVYLWLYRELLTSQERAEELDTRTHQLATLQVGVLTAMLRTLALRDHMTARHSAAVARYARELARAAGCSDDEVELVHTAGLLHDIGKFIFPDHILLADSRLSDEDWEIVKCHPFQGAKIVREVEGYGPVADIILGHHERIDGKGYPRGMQGEEIPLLARVISVCDTYDVMTARDSYREPVPQDAALEELRRVAGKQLDARLVEIFADLVSRGELGFRHGDDADFEAELQFERRVRDYAAPQPHAVPAAA
ncbi:HD domain-containing protein [Svornostia abyssi]|uniref:HD domain-containing protein n=1 Tax=Svornostia abyssi TaxID=2898438 RepID=A0ABY5PG04_9ACTN|nr:HD domain-containing protein [Parviterribacteraceae bacterium J379]